MTFNLGSFVSPLQRLGPPVGASLCTPQPPLQVEEGGAGPGVLPAQPAPGAQPPGQVLP